MVRTKGKEAKCTWHFVERPEEYNHLEELTIEVRLKCILHKYYGNKLNGLICVTIESKWLAPVGILMNIRVPQKAGNFLIG
jgi:hypothetical protein